MKISYQIYHDIKNENRIIEEEMQRIESEYVQIYKTSLDGTPAFKGVMTIKSDRIFGGVRRMSFFPALGTTDDLRVKYRKLERLLMANNAFLEEIDKRLQSFEGTKEKIAYKRLVEGKTLGEIAGELYLSVDRVKQLSAEVTKELQGVS